MKRETIVLTIKKGINPGYGIFEGEDYIRGAMNWLDLQMSLYTLWFFFNRLNPWTGKYKNKGVNSKRLDEEMNAIQNMKNGESLTLHI